MNYGKSLFLYLGLIFFPVTNSSATSISVGCTNGVGVVNEYSTTSTQLQCEESGTIAGTYGYTHDTSASVDLKTGEMRLYASHVSDFPSNRAAASAAASETINIEGGSGTIPVTVLFTAEGFGTGIEPSNGNEVRVDTRISNVGGGILERSFTDIGWDSSGLVAVSDLGNNNFYFSGDSFKVVQTLTYDINLDVTRSLLISGFLNIWAAQAALDMRHTAFFDLILPEGISFSSQSGVFLTEPRNSGDGGQVPEPSTLALLGLGLAGIGFARKKKQA